MTKKINIDLSNKAFYFIIVIIVVAFISVGVTAFGGNNPMIMGHSLGEFSIPDTCSNDQILKIYNGKLECGESTESGLNQINVLKLIVSKICLNDECRDVWPEEHEVDTSLVYNHHTYANCKDYNGVVDYENYYTGDIDYESGIDISSTWFSNAFCVFDRTTCPLDWKSYKDWMRTETTTCGGRTTFMTTCTAEGHELSEEGIDCCEYSTLCTLGMEDWDDCKDGSRAYFDCCAPITQVACY
ncbi:hypothetical protein KAS08_05220 [Candidatus Pacearchaeota archaeon]|nr:hypothetical protein [Candidatus Pacearchaeota archaeon]